MLNQVQHDFFSLFGLFTNSSTIVSKLRLIDQIGKLSEEDIQKVEHAVKVQLGLSGSIEKG